jgi:hypothetical protein
MKKTTTLFLLLFLSVLTYGQNMQLRSHLPYSPVNLANMAGTWIR